MKLKPTRRGLAAGAAVTVALSIAAGGLPSYANPSTISPFLIDGSLVPDGDADRFPDASGTASELGPVNASSTKLGVIHTAPTPMLATTNPNAQVDLKNIWLDTGKDSTGDIWLYLAWQRDSNKGSGVIMYEFLQGDKPVACDYSKLNTAQQGDLVAQCNPFANRRPGDFILVWDQQGGSTAIGKRTWTSTDDGDGLWEPLTEPLRLGPTVDLTAGGDAEAAYSSDKFFGEATVNLSDTIFPPTPTSCFTVGNIVPGTVTGNSDTADYKDVVLANITDTVQISNCGTVTVTKKTDPAGGSGSFGYTLARSGGAALDYTTPTNLTQRTGTLTTHLDSETQQNLREGTNYTLTEQIGAGTPYDLRSIVCTLGTGQYTLSATSPTFPVSAGSVTDCVITNAAQKVNLTLVKTVTNDDGGTAAPTAWDLTALRKGTTTKVIDAAETGSTAASVTTDAGTFVLSESGGPSGYTAGSWSCTGGSLAASELTLTSGQSATCTINNNDQPATLTLVKQVTKDDGGSADPTDWTLAADGATDISGTTGSAAVTSAAVDAGSYDLSESDGPAGYTPSDWVCTGGNQTDADTVVLAVGESATCAIINDDQPALLTLVKRVTNDDGGTAAATAWTLSADGPTDLSGATGTTPVTLAPVDTGTYDLSESVGPAGYTASAWVCVGGRQTDGDTMVLTEGQSATCTITNDDQPGTLVVNKTVVNDDGGALGPETFQYALNGGDPVPFEEDGSNSQSVRAGIYTALETPVDGYSQTENSCIDVVVPSGGRAACTIVNDDDPGTLVVNKVVVNDNGGTLGADAFSYEVDGGTAIAFEADGSNSQTVDAGTYDVTEPAVAGYTETANTCVDVVIANGETKECTITNDDDPGTLVVNKVVVNDNGGTLGADAFSYEVDGGTAVAFEADGSNSQTVDAGTYDVTEPAVAGYTETANTCVDVVIANGETKECTITNDDDKASPTGETLQRWVLHDTLLIDGLRLGAQDADPDADPATATFRLYSGSSCAAADLVGSESVDVTGIAPTTVDGIAVTSPGEYHWRVTYSGDQFNTGFTTDCAAEVTFIRADDWAHNLTVD